MDMHALTCYGFLVQSSLTAMQFLSVDNTTYNVCASLYIILISTFVNNIKNFQPDAKR